MKTCAGFAGAAGNIVINGQGPSSKAENLETILARIPANRVLKVEVGPGDLYGAEYSGKAQVLNVFLSAEAGIDGTLTMKARRLYTGMITPDISASALIKRGQSSFNVAAGADNFRRHRRGHRHDHHPPRRRAGRVPPQVQRLSRLLSLCVGRLGV